MDDAGYYVSPDEAAIFGEVWDDLERAGDLVCDVLQTMVVRYNALCERAELYGLKTEPSLGLAAIDDWDSARHGLENARDEIRKNEINAIAASQSPISGAPKHAG